MSDRPPSARADRVARVLGAVQIALGAALVLVFLYTAALALGERPPAPDEERRGNGNWAWGMAIFLVPPGLALALMGWALRRGWPGRWWWQLIPLLAMAGCVAALGVG